MMTFPAGDVVPGSNSRSRRFATGFALAAMLAVTVSTASPGIALAADPWTPPLPAPPLAATVETADTGSATFGRGGLISSERLRTMSASQVRAILTGAGFDADATVIRSGVETYRIVYRTIDARGRTTTASGLVALPRTDARRLRAVSYTHGTEISRVEAPSTATNLEADAWGQAPAITYAAAGFAGVAPDYLGLGVGPGPHPWIDVPSETTASLDMLRAARAFIAGTGRTLDREVLVTGFSQGAAAAMGLGRALRSGADTWFRLGALAPISGAYDWRSVEVAELLSGRLPWPWGVGYTAYLLVGVNRVHHIYDTPGEVFKDPAVQTLFDGDHSGEQLAAGLPKDLDGLLTPHGFDLLRNPRGPMAEALRIADSTCTGWVPRVPVRLYVGGADTQVPHANSEHCQVALRAGGTDAPIFALGTDVDHERSNQVGTAAVVRWFSQLHADRP